jgi:deferrochelatase/peroxidase EfeB
MTAPEKTDSAPGDSAAAGRGPSRRRLLTGAGAAGAGVVAGGLAGYFGRSATTAPAAGAGGVAGDSNQTVSFYGPHQAGIATAAQDRLAFGALNVVDGASRADLRDLLRQWTQAAARMTRGALVGEVGEPNAPPLDTGEAVAGLAPDHHPGVRPGVVRPPFRIVRT